MFGRNREVLQAGIVIAITAVYQYICATHGFDLTDEGHLMSAYQWFGTDPLACRCGSGYPLSCLLGWLCLSVWPQGGILWMRICGILLVVLTEIIAYRFLSRYFNSSLVLVGIALSAIFVAGDPKPFGYNTLSGLFAVISVVLAVRSGEGKVWLPALAGGVVAGVSVFLRLPNVCYLAFAAIPLFFITKEDWKGPLARAFIFAGGFVAGLSAAGVAVKAAGADVLVKEFLGSIVSTLGGGSSHSSGSMLSTYAGNYARAFFCACTLLFCIRFCGWASRKSKVMYFIAVLLLMFFGYRYLYIGSHLLGEELVTVFNGIALVGVALMFESKAEAGKLRIAMAALFSSLVIPLGSDLGFRTMWVGCWLALPVGICGFYDYFSDRRERFAYVAFLVALLVVAVVKIDHKPYYDPGARSEKKYEINSAYAKGIKTVQKKAVIVNELLAALEDYVKEGDELLVYDFSPTINYLTGTKPFAGVSWPCVLYGQRYVRAVAAAEAAGSRPVAVIQHFNCINGWRNIDEGYFVDGRTREERQMTAAVMDFIHRNGYRSVWTNGYFEILVAE